MAAGAGSGEQWSSRLGFLLAAVGFAVGMGNIWRFPYQLGENGGSAFLILYLACALGIGLPLHPVLLHRAVRLDGGLPVQGGQRHLYR